MARLWPYLWGLLAAVLGGGLAHRLKLPIPWLLGSLLTTALLTLRGAPVKAFAPGRQMGLALIGISLGLYFTPALGRLLLAHSGWLLAAVAFAVLLGLMGSLLLHRWAGVDFKTAWFAAAVGGASEMANLAQQQGARVDQVVASHALRVLLVVSVVPFFYRFMGWHGADFSDFASRAPGGFPALVLLLAIGGAGGGLFKLLRLPNPWTFGPLLASAALTLSGVHLATLPPALSALGQLLIGWSLGNKFAPGFFRRAPQLLAITAVNVALSLLLTALAAGLINRYSGLGGPTLGLALAPGGVAEMTITARALNLGVPLVTLFHIARMVAVVASATAIYELLARWLKLT